MDSQGENKVGVIYTNIVNNHYATPRPSFVNSLAAIGETSSPSNHSVELEIGSSCQGLIKPLVSEPQIGKKFRWSTLANAVSSRLGHRNDSYPSENLCVKAVRRHPSFKLLSATTGKMLSIRRCSTFFVKEQPIVRVSTQQNPESTPVVSIRNSITPT